MGIPNCSYTNLARVIQLISRLGAVITKSLYKSGLLSSNKVCRQSSKRLGSLASKSKVSCDLDCANGIPSFSTIVMRPVLYLVFATWVPQSERVKDQWFRYLVEFSSSSSYRRNSLVKI